MNRTILIEERNQYGRLTYYVTGEHSAPIAALTGKKTVDKRDVLALEQLGFDVVLQGRQAQRASSIMK